MNSNQKIIKWATKNTRKTRAHSSRIEKPKTQKPARKTMLHKAVEQTERSGRMEKLKKLQKEWEFAHDSLASVIVNLESIHHAYKSSESELEETKSATRLCEKEKELLTAYSEVKLQASHLERKIAKLEKQMNAIKDLDETHTYLSSPCSSIDTSLSYTTPVTHYAQPDPTLDTTYDMPYGQQLLDYQTCPIDSSYYCLDPSFACNPLFGYDDYLSNTQFFYDYTTPYPII
ncbi:hypothetical protein BY458DRAFT_497224 [Sporodiniella umbellata]|nr:hypothetical protein BY458DRAFT_497224 [Sporodiniella umbellata]